jgi:DNA-binding winged helix-turn-helix (wHTH) protein
VKNREMDAKSQQFRIGDLKLDIDRQIVSRRNDRIELAGLSYRLLKVLAERWPATVSRRELAKEVWGDSVVSDDAVRQRIRLLRQSLGESEYIVAVKAVGYRLKYPVRVLVSSGFRSKYAVAAGVLVLGLVAYVILGGDSVYDIVHEIKHSLRH